MNKLWAGVLNLDETEKLSSSSVAGSDDIVNVKYPLPSFFSELVCSFKGQEEGGNYYYFNSFRVGGDF